jgi:fatty-acyl-CoA synthase
LTDSLSKLGVLKGERIGTLAWNHHRHLEAYFAIPCMGAVLHTINIRLSPQHIFYIINHAEDKTLLVDPDILPLLESCASELKTVNAFIIMTDEKELPETTLSPVYHYEKLLSEANPNFQYPLDIDQNDPAGMCYTSATTGNPIGVVYSHRGIFLHSMALGLADSAAVSEKDIALPVVPMFHANAWGMPFAAVWFGTSLVLPGPYFTPKLL